MNTIEIVKLLELSIRDSLVENMEKKITMTDFGIQLNKDNKQVYRTHFSLNLDFVQDTPVAKCQNTDNPVKVRRTSDKERLELMASELLGLFE